MIKTEKDNLNQITDYTYRRINMKIHFIIAAAILFISIIGCDNPVENKRDNTLYGTWQLKEITGGFAGVHEVLDISKDNRVAVFSLENLASFYHNGSLVRQSKFTITKEKTSRSVDSMEVITYTQDMTKHIILIQRNDTLLLDENYIDGFSYLYTRLY
jgi:hypothetical protein